MVARIGAIERVVATLLVVRPRAVHLVGLEQPTVATVPLAHALTEAIGTLGDDVDLLTLAAPDHADAVRTEPTVAFAWLPGLPAPFDTTLGRLCRCYPEMLVVAHPGGSVAETPPAQRFFAFGFHRLSLYDPLPADPDTGARADEHWCAYRYRLHDYKTAPEWLNARFWANPERFDQDPDASG